MRTKRITLFIMALVVAALVAGDLLVAFSTAAEIRPAVEAETVLVAQNQPVKKRRTLMDLLFGNRQRDEAPARVVKKPKQAAAPVPEKPKVEKSATATRLMVFGDSMANDLARALERFYAEDPNLVVVNSAVSAAGFVDPGPADLPKAVADAIAAESFDIAVVMAGVNDNQSLDLNGDTVKPGTPGWRDAYSRRVRSVAAALRTAKLPLVFVGLPPMEAPKLAQVMVGINEIDRLAVFSAGGEFLDIYERFSGEDGGYTARGPDVNGNVVRMRKDDGIHLSTAGADKLAFFVSQTLRTWYSGTGGAGIAIADPLAGTEAAAMLRPPYQGLGQATLLRVAGPVLPLTGQPKRAADLLTATTAPGDPGFSLDALVAPPPDRADSFAVPR